MNSTKQRLFAITIIILSIPFVAMQYSQHVQWHIMDFIVMAAMLLSVGSTFVVLSRRFPKQKFLFAFALLFVFIIVWVELAVGIFAYLGT